MLTKGRQFHIGFKRSEHFQDFVAPGGSATTLFSLAKEPVSFDSVKLFVGTVPAGNERLVRRGVHYDLEVTVIPAIDRVINRWTIVWRADSPFPLTSINTVSAVYFTKE